MNNVAVVQLSVGADWAVGRTSDCTNPAFDPVSCCCSSQPGWWTASICSFSALAAAAAQGCYSGQTQVWVQQKYCLHPFCEAYWETHVRASALGEQIDRVAASSSGGQISCSFPACLAVFPSGMLNRSFRPENWDPEQSGSFLTLFSLKPFLPSLYLTPKKPEIFLRRQSFS